MGNSLVLYGRRPADLALAAGIQGAARPADLPARSD